MIENPTADYRARLGGILYWNVHHPIVVNDQPMITFSRNSETGNLGVNVDLFQQDGSPIASVKQNDIVLHNAKDFLVLNGKNRSAIVEKHDGRVRCDIATHVRYPEYEIAVSCILFTNSGYPILLHPDRSKFGMANSNEPPTISRLRLSTVPKSHGAAVVLKSGAAYLFASTIENFRTGVQITQQGTPYGTD